MTFITSWTTTQYLALLQSQFLIWREVVCLRNSLKTCGMCRQRTMKRLPKLLPVQMGLSSKAPLQVNNVSVWTATVNSPPPPQLGQNDRRKKHFLFYFCAAWDLWFVLLGKIYFRIFCWKILLKYMKFLWTEMIFLICERFNQPAESRYLALDIFDR